MKIKKHYINWIIFASIIAAGLVLDLVTKTCFEGMEKSLIGNFLWITSTHNQGAAFGMLEGARWWFIGLSIPALAAIFYIIFARKMSEKPLFIISISMITSGIIGNLVDRIFLGYVRDFIDFRFSGFAIFNFADSLLCIGCALLVLFLIIWSIQDYKQAKNKKTNGENNKTPNEKLPDEEKENGNT